MGRIAQVGNAVKKLKVGQQVGLGWNSQSCMTCEWCMSENHNL
ncbi:alcohol dehydrogenase catalytic domain-containing protein [Phormidesmis priestleyi]